MSERVTPEQLERLRYATAHGELGASIRALLSERERLQERLDGIAAIATDPSSIGPVEAADPLEAAFACIRALASTPNPEEWVCPQHGRTSQVKAVGETAVCAECGEPVAYSEPPDPTPEPEEER